MQKLFPSLKQRSTVTKSRSDTGPIPLNLRQVISIFSSFVFLIEQRTLYQMSIGSRIEQNYSESMSFQNSSRVPSTFSTTPLEAIRDSTPILYMLQTFQPFTFPFSSQAGLAIYFLKLSRHSIAYFSIYFIFFYLLSSIDLYLDQNIQPKFDYFFLQNFQNFKKSTIKLNLKEFLDQLKISQNYKRQQPCDIGNSQLLFQQDISQRQTMGNVDLTVNQKLMQTHSELVADFRSQKPLYNVEDIKFPLFTKGIKIVDSTGRRVKLAGGNWSGAHMCRHCVDGLQCRSLRDIAMDIRYKFKMNCIRLTYSLQMFYDNKKIPEKYLKANPELIGKTGMQIFDITVATLTQVGLMVILNNHTSTSQWCCSNDDGDGLWWSRQFPEYKFFQNCEEFARRYSENPRVIGMDLRNELRKANGLQASWGDGKPLTDWHRAASICGQKVLKIAPHWLIMVSGVNYQLDLTGVQTATIRYSVPNKLIYTGHFYGFSWPIPSWAMVSYEDFKKKLFNSQTFVRAMGYPYFLGQFGNNCKDVPWNYLIRYLKQTDIDWTYWALDGFKCEPQTDETYGVFTNDFKGARHPDLLEDMISVGPPLGTIIQPPKSKQYQYPKTNQYLLRGQNPKQIRQDRKLEQPTQISNNNYISNINHIVGNTNNTGNLDPRFLLSFEALSQNRNETPQIIQTPQIQQIQQVQGQKIQNQFVGQPKIIQNYQPIQTQNFTTQFAEGFTGNRYIPNQQFTNPQNMTTSIRSSVPNNQFLQPQNNYLQGKQQAVSSIQPGQNQPQNSKGQVIYFDSNGRPILR